MKNKVLQSDRRAHKNLVSLLTRFVEPDDLGLPREQFLRAVLDRIVNDLSKPLRSS